MSSHFVPAYDTWFDQWAADWGTKNKVEVQADHILSSDLAAKNAAEVAARGGHDIYKFSRNGEPVLYHTQMIDVSDVAKQISEAHGGWIPFGETLGLVEGVWHAVPEYFIDFPRFTARTSSTPTAWRRSIPDDLLKTDGAQEQRQPNRHCRQSKSNDANNT
jgi:multiple sugar transport system substrate-binding protein